MSKDFVNSVKLPSAQEMQRIQREAKVLRAQFLKDVVRRVFHSR